MTFRPIAEIMQSVSDQIREAAREMEKGECVAHGQRSARLSDKRELQRDDMDVRSMEGRRGDVGGVGYYPTAKEAKAACEAK